MLKHWKIYHKTEKAKKVFPVLSWIWSKKPNSNKGKSQKVLACESFLCKNHWFRNCGRNIFWLVSHCFPFSTFLWKKEVLRRRMTICARRIRNLITNETANSEETSRLLSPQNGFSGKNFYVRRFHKRRISFPSFREKIFTIFSHKIISFLQSSLSRINWGRPFERCEKKYFKTRQGSES